MIQFLVMIAFLVWSSKKYMANDRSLAVNVNMKFLEIARNETLTLNYSPIPHALGYRTYSTTRTEFGVPRAVLLLFFGVNLGYTWDHDRSSWVPGGSIQHDAVNRRRSLLVQLTIAKAIRFLIIGLQARIIHHGFLDNWDYFNIHFGAIWDCQHSANFL